MSCATVELTPGRLNRERDETIQQLCKLQETHDEAIQQLWQRAETQSRIPVGQRRQREVSLTTLTK